MIILAVVSGIGMMVGVIALGILLSGSMNTGTIDFDSGWTVDFNGEIYEGVNMSDFIFPKMCAKGDTIILSNTLPDTEGKSLSFRVLLYLSKVEVRINDELRYSYGEAEYDSGRMLGSGYHYVPIHPWDSGADMVITIKPGENNAFSSINGIALIPASERISIFAKAYLLTFFVSIFLVMLGFAILITSVITFFQGLKNIRLFYIGCFSFFIGIWSMCSDKLISLFSGYRELYTAFEYLALYMAVIPFVSLILEMRDDASKWRKAVLRAVRSVSIIFVVISVILHITQIAHFPALLECFHILVALELVAVLIAAVKPFSQMNRADRFLNAGIFVFALAGGIDVARFNLQKFLLVTNHNLDSSVIPFGALIFMILLIMSYLVYLYDELIMQTEKHTLERLAYEDSLTGLYNRTRSEERFAELKESPNLYALIMIDLNGLKKTNDTLGHVNGDRLLITFGKILSNVFEGIGEAYRMGGDEYLVISENQNKNTVYTALYQMEASCKRAGEENPFVVEAAYGIAFSDESEDNDPESIAHLADGRMYEMKQNMKKDKDNKNEG